MSFLSSDSVDFLLLAFALLIAVVATIFALRLSIRYGEDGSVWKNRHNDLHLKYSRLDSLFGAFPGLVMAWNGPHIFSGTEWATPKIFGSPAAMAAINQYAEPGKDRNSGTRILNGIADLDTLTPDGKTTKTLRTYLRDLQDTGKAFSISVIVKDGHAIDIDGRNVGEQPVIWITDRAIRGQNEFDIIRRFENQKGNIERDPIGFIDMMLRAPFPAWRVSGTGRLNWVNPAYVVAVGAEDEEVVIEDQILLDKSIIETTQQVINTQSSTQNIRTMIIDGRRKATQITMYPVSGGAIGIAMDATETQALKDTLTQHIRAHDEMLNNLDEAIVIFGADQRMSFHNTAFETMFKLEKKWFADRLTHSEWLDHMREKQRLPIFANYSAWKETELGYYTDWPSEVPDEIWSLPNGKTLRLARMRDPQGGISLLFSDITDSIFLQGQFNTLINVQTATLDKLSEGIAVFGTDGRLRLSNTAFTQLWGLSEEDLSENQAFDEIIEKCLPLYHYRNFWNEMKARTTDANPEVRRHEDGEIERSDQSILKWFSKPLPDGATMVAWEDVTGARNVEKALREKAAALETADRLKSEFVGHVSYQLRTPLTTISGYANFLQDESIGELNDKQSECMFAIQTASEELDKTIKDILDIAAIDANVLDLELGDVDVYALLDQSQDYVGAKADDTRKTITLDCPEDIGLIRADEARLKQVVYNLLSNAMRFTKPGGVIEFGARRSHQGGIHIWVKDNGVGIPYDQQPKVFESFRSSRGGAGLGLSLVQKFIEAHGGWVELESSEGVGTHVSVYLPAEASKKNAIPELDFKEPA